MVKNQAEGNKKIMKILTSDNSSADFSKLALNLKQKILITSDKFVEKKTLKLEVKISLFQLIQENVLKDYNKIYTFSPKNNKSNIKKRNVSEFLKDQEIHMKRTHEKIAKMTFESKRKLNNENDDHKHMMTEVK